MLWELYRERASLEQVFRQLTAAPLSDEDKGEAALVGAGDAREEVDA